MTLTFDQPFNQQSYQNLLAETLPRTIETEAEYDRFLTLVEKLHVKKQKRSPEESALYKLFVVLIEDYEERAYPMPVSPPHQILRHILESSGTTTADLVGLLGSQEIVDEIVAGQRTIDRTQAMLLGDRFQVSASLFC